jgi:anaerobic magnesium-protoporphyrin IX monomethyl ester cyclase
MYMPMKITFIDPPNLLSKRNFERVFGCTFSLYPIPNIFSLSSAAVLEQNGFSAAYLDMAAMGWKESSLRAFLSADDSDAYCLHSINLSQESDLEAQRIISQIRPKTPVIFTGPAPTYFADSFLSGPDTFVVRGEPEEGILELARSLEADRGAAGINGVSYLENGTVVHNPARALAGDLDLFPFPARHLLKKGLYYNPKLPRLPFTAMQTSRNCSYQCTFCVPNSYNFARELEYKKFNQDHKPPIRVRTSQSVIAEFQELRKQGYRSVSVIDDQFLWDEARTVAICRGIQDTGIEWGCLARADRINETVAQSLASASCRYVDMGIESFNQEVLDEVHKNLEVKKVFEAVKLLKKHKMLVKINLVLGLSKIQDREVIMQDIATAKKLDVDMVMFSLATPFPGTELYKKAQAENLFTGKGYAPASVQSHSVIHYPGLSDRELDRLVRKANISFYLRPRMLLGNLKLLFSPFRLYRSLLAFKRKFL